MADLFSGLGSLLGGLFGSGGDPYKKAMKQFEKYGNRAQNAQNPFYQAGAGSIPQFQDWLKQMSNPSEFINKLEGQYQESPHTKYLQDQAMRASTNMGSASGLTGSTPLTQFAQQNASDIASGGMQDWLSNVLGANTQYGAGLGSMMQGGQGAANSLSNIFGNLGDRMGQGAYGQSMGNQQKLRDIISGLFGTASGGQEDLMKFLPFLMMMG